jgi:hypothetical protein
LIGYPWDLLTVDLHARVIAEAMFAVDDVKEKLIHSGLFGCEVEMPPNHLVQQMVPKNVRHRTNVPLRSIVMPQDRPIATFLSTYLRISSTSEV